jgi:hypothetical protein
MSRYYVDVTGVPDDFLEFMGYCKVKENHEFELRVAKDKEYILRKNGAKYLYVEDPNDASLFHARAKVAAPPIQPRPRKAVKKASKKAKKKG